MFDLVSPYAPAGDQPQAIAKLTEALLPGARQRVLLGVTTWSQRLTSQR
jgi:excinuclease ABC subunit B